MTLWERRPLTDGEVALGRGVFDDEIDWPRVRVAQGPPLTFAAMVPLGRTIWFSRWRAARDFADTDLDEQGWFVHELMHVWQAERGVVLAASKLSALGRKAYRYKAELGLKLTHYNIERQAEIARHLFLSRADMHEDGMPPRDWLEQIWAARSKGRASAT
ncbi:MAG: hypothetical protein K2P58_10920 [Hyphomonadaceae bacterium]|nr:hypothetical protein [Hyphomonadaceae bacterium]